MFLEGLATNTLKNYHRVLNRLLLVNITPTLFLRRLNMTLRNWLTDRIRESMIARRQIVLQRRQPTNNLVVRVGRRFLMNLTFADPS